MSQKTVSNFKRRQRTRLSLKIFLAFLAFSGILGLSLLSVERAFKIKDISVSGASRAEKDRVGESVRNFLDGKKAIFLSRANPFFFDKDELADYLKKEFPPIETVLVERDFLDKKLNLTLNERKGWAVWCAKSCFYLDNQGVLFQPAPQFFGSLILKIADERPREFSQGEQILDGNFFFSFKKFIEDAEKTGNTSIKSIKITADHSFWLETASGWKILVDTGTDFARANENLKLFADSTALKEKLGELDYIDLRFPDKGFYKFK